VAGSKLVRLLASFLWFIGFQSLLLDACRFFTSTILFALIFVEFWSCFYLLSKQNMRNIDKYFQCYQVCCVVFDHWWSNLLKVYIVEEFWYVVCIVWLSLYLFFFFLSSNNNWSGRLNHKFWVGIWWFSYCCCYVLLVRDQSVQYKTFKEIKTQRGKMRNINVKITRRDWEIERQCMWLVGQKTYLLLDPTFSTHRPTTRVSIKPLMPNYMHTYIYNCVCVR